MQAVSMDEKNNFRDTPVRRGCEKSHLATGCMSVL